jgi:hypothetical protein
MNRFQQFRKGLYNLLLGVLAVVIWVEQWGFKHISHHVKKWAQWSPLKRLESRIQQLPAYGAVSLFLLLGVFFFLIKIAALSIIHSGKTALGLFVLISAKLIGTVLVGRLFTVTERQLVQLAWFAQLLQWWRMTKQRLMLNLRGSLFWRRLRQIRAGLRLKIKAFWRRYF